MCKFSNDWVPIGWPQYRLNESNPNDYRVYGLYDVFCNKCKKYVNLLSGKEIDPDGRIKINQNA